MIKYDAKIKYQKDKEYTRQEKEYFVAKNCFDFLTSSDDNGDSWIWNVLHGGMDDKPISQLTDDELEKEWLDVKESLDEELEYDKEN